jgi:hypothetical protein
MKPDSSLRVVLGCVPDWQQETRGLFRLARVFMVTDPASGIGRNYTN